MRDRIPIGADHVAEVERRLDAIQAAGPKPRTAWTKQALIDRVSGRLDAMRAEGFSLEDLSDAVSYGGVTFTAEMLSSYISRRKLAAPGNAPGKAARDKLRPRKGTSEVTARTPVKTAATKGRTSSPEQIGRADAATDAARDPLPLATLVPAPGVALQAPPDAGRREAMPASPKPGGRPGGVGGKDWMQAMTP